MYAVAFHRLHDFSAEKQAGLLLKAGNPRQLGGGAAFLVDHDKIKHVKCRLKRNLHAVEQCVGLGTLDLVASGALPVAIVSTFTIFGIAALFAAVAVAPLDGYEVIQTLLDSTEIFFESIDSHAFE